MKNVTSIKNLILAAAISLGLTTVVFAQSANVAVPNPAEPRSAGLLGQNYVSLTYGFIDLQGTGVDAHSYNLELNQNVREGLDTFLGYSHGRSDRFAGSRLKSDEVFLGGRAFMDYQGVRPFIDAGIGWAWLRGFGTRDDSFAWGVGVGAEFAVATTFSVAPYVRYSDLTKYSGSGTWNYGAKANYWLTPRLALTGGVDRDDDRNMEYTGGVNFRF